MWLKGIVGILLASAMTIPAHSREIFDVVAHERAAYAQSCKTIEFDDSLLWKGDLDQDKLQDVIVNTAAVSCDGRQGPDCNALGCLFRIYLKLADGTYRSISQTRAYSMSVEYQYGIRIIKFRIAGTACGRMILDRCTMTVRIKGWGLTVMSTR